ncbi:phosphoribosyltransferase-like protein [Deinococcus sp. ME38]|uniref:phosphoribosyltransferase-like protein n=1 Tax=Deinococcus sp. ME38 TaxID=3400344 RepID=UPI003B5936BF
MQQRLVVDIETRYYEDLASFGSNIEALITMGEVDWKRYHYNDFINSFPTVEMKFVAIYLAASVLFLSENLCISMLSKKIFPIVEKIRDSSDIFFVVMQGEDINVVDSGFVFTRIIRRITGLVENKYYKSLDQIFEMTSLGRTVEIILVDDIMATGDQFNDMFTRPRRNQLGEEFTIGQMVERGLLKIRYYPILCTEAALERYDQYDQYISPCIILDHTYNILNNIDAYFPQWLCDQIDILSTVQAMCELKSIPSYGIAGHGGLGLAISFFHSTPDSTLPLLWQKDDNGISLLERF